VRPVLVASILISCAARHPYRASPEPAEAFQATTLRDTHVEVVEAEEEPVPGPERVESGVIELPLEGFEPAVAVLPQTREKVPLVIAAHGAGGSPEWQCEHWRRIVRERAIVLCPRGRRISLRYEGSYYYPDHFELGREFLAMLGAARERFGDRILEGAGIYTGFSQGATMGALMIVDHGRDFPFLLLIEGATAEFSGARARTFKASGGQRVDYVCGGSWCAKRAANMVATLERAGLEASLAHVRGGGHTDDGRVGQKAAELFEGLLERALAQGRR
jgi:predicted esterase